VIVRRELVMEKGERKDVAPRPELAILLLSFESRRHLKLRARLRSKPEGKDSCRRTQTFPAIRWEGDIDLENGLWRGNCGSVLSSAPTAQKQFLSIIFYDSQNSQNRWKRGHEYPTRGSPMWHNIKLNFHFKVVKPS